MNESMKMIASNHNIKTDTKTDNNEKKKKKKWYKNGIKNGIIFSRIDM